VRSLINSRSDSAMAASNLDGSRHCGLDVSHTGSPSDLKNAPASLVRSNEGQVVEYEEVSNRGKTSAENLRVQR
jgi:hypothetical protein